MALKGEYAPGTWQWAREQVAVYEASDGHRGGTLHGRPVVILTSVGARTGMLRKTPLMRVEHDGAYLAVGSMGGAPRDPAWCRNLRVNPRVDLQDGERRWEMEARELDGAEREVWWERAVEAFPTYAAYQEKAPRLIPVFLLERVPAEQ